MNASPNPTLYDILGVDRHATQDQIKDAFHKLIREVHPDQASPALAHLAQQINDAYAVLKDLDKRAAYDKDLDTGRPGGGSDNPETGFTQDDFGWGQTGDYTAPPSGTGGIPPQANPWDQSGGSDDDGLPLPSLNDYRVVFDPARLIPGGPLKPESIIPTVHPVKRCWWLFAISWVCVVAVVVGLSMVGQGSSGVAQAMVIGSVVLLVTSLVTSPTMQQLMRVLWVLSAVGAGLTVLVGLMVLVGSVGSGQGGFLVGLAIALLLIGATVPQLIGSRWMRAAREANLNTPTQVSVRLAGQRIAGTPGDLGDALSKFTTLNVAKGIVGEKLTYGLLGWLSQTPGVRVFNGMRFPGSANGDVDHIVVCGKKLALIDSKLWMPARYAWQPNGSILRTAGTISKNMDNHMPNAVAAYQQLFPGFQVAGWVLIHPNGDPADLAVDNTYATSVRLADAQTTMAETYRWLTSDHTGEVDRRDLARLYQWMKR